MEEKTLFEDFTTLRWVKWTKRKPKSNGMFYIRWNGKYTSMGHVINGKLYTLDGQHIKTVQDKNCKTTVKYSLNQKRLMKDMYWLEELHDLKGYNTYHMEVYNKFLAEKEQEFLNKTK